MTRSNANMALIIYPENERADIIMRLESAGMRFDPEESSAVEQAIYNWDIYWQGSGVQLTGAYARGEAMKESLQAQLVEKDAEIKQLKEDLAFTDNHLLKKYSLADREEKEKDEEITLLKLHQKNLFHRLGYKADGKIPESPDLVKAQEAYNYVRKANKHTSHDIEVVATEYIAELEKENKALKEVKG